MQKVSAYILAFNEAEKITAAIESVLWADEIIVLDSHSIDRTAEIAASLGARVVQVPFNGYGDLRNRAIEACRHEWIFSLDADERCTEAVRDEVLSLIAGSDANDIYRIPRRNYLMGRWIRGSGWYPNFRQPQLFRKGSMRYTLDAVHEGYLSLSRKPIGTLKNAIWQIPFRNFEEMLGKINRYSSLGVQKLAHKRVSMGSALGHATWAFLKHYFFKLGFIDGWAGFIIALQSFESTIYRYAKRYEAQQNWAPPASSPIRREGGS
jgi:glycosyltransferase involved in cell wall biosynthesis